jgi:hypothetical protein
MLQCNLMQMGSLGLYKGQVWPEIQLRFVVRESTT